MSAQHTPGPWEYRAAGPRSANWTVVAGDKMRVCLVPPRFHGPGRSDGCANAALIAAAPDLLAALEAVEAIADWEGPPDGHFLATWAAARAAITKAQGITSQERSNP